ncbi:DNA polymerase epsilon, catalytic subunit A, putative [Coccidioides posadasii C735 delta SOWgp]|uniref:DNA polymerase epsilon catalytic subunit n=1 Tax=Coccidioides posadasii (strain C735) TaxID=222929 RepID=C5PFB9_COCP7|nr:DNA polymerase epsilon, catalytic subunit A, putative [Coccidioides posadasii C735 delta SOWgp]EER23247.1 DNA polymerase epsilon, catalytic subunit A, putative [Coccidioides posadasii C735 delta SOWgp]|eukprot:XP_003065392.1 DNA polymerase epsilon, catalytic subunit A, putative [Coccidioides posadasii C735 delta SOWgp]
MSRRPSKYGSKFRSAAASFRPKRAKTVEFSALRISEATSQDEKFQALRLANSIDESMGFPRFESGKKRIGWLCNMHSTTIEDPKVPGGRAGVEFYFLEDDGGSFKATVEYDPYFLIAAKRGYEMEVEEWCRRKFEGLVKSTKQLEKEDLQMPNHLLGNKRKFLQLSFANVNDLLAVRKVILPIAEKNKKNVNAMDTYAEIASASAGFDMFDDEMADKTKNAYLEASEFIVDIREYDVPYHVRVSIDKDIRIGKWYTVDATHGAVSLTCIEERLQRADPVVLAFDIETTKLPLKFPDPVIDQIMMISYMIDGQGYLITNREIVSEDISNFEYTPKPEYQGPFTIFNEPSEKSTIERFFQHVKEAKPTVIATYNGDYFDWSFVEARASVQGIDMYREIGFRKNSEDIYQSDYCVHMDCFAWVNRDSYLPQGSRGLKAVTVAKLGYDPDELDPEVMTRYASERPQTLAEYSVSDAVATYYLYMKYIHPFIFSLCTIIPLNPDDVLRKGTGTLCEMLLMVQAYKNNIILPNKHKDPIEAFWDGHLLDSETYVGGHVESIEAGVFRSDIPVNFSIDTTAIDELLRDLDAALTFSITVEEKKSLDDITNYDDVKAQISDRLMNLKNTPNRYERPSIYHLDVASMYPNIMTTNRLQPDSMIKESDCAVCDFNRPGKTCDRRLPWAWRGEFLPAKRDEYNMIRRAVANEKFPGKTRDSPLRSFDDLSESDQAKLVKSRLQEYCKKIYHKIHDSKTIEREAIICQRENPFYVDTVRNFRDRRYDFKGQQKVWKGKVDILKGSGATAPEIEEAKKMVVLFDSLQLAHKVILNSFYGYVMRKGSRWYSMEMAGVTCLTGAHIIQMARELVERIGRPLELDTDGIWCMLPATFPENFAFTLKNGKKIAISYPCVMLNHLVHGRFTNHQYQTLVDPTTFRYETHSDNSIFFEVDGPYKAMILPTSKEEDKNLKKRYAVFNHDGSLAELKGFEVKRRGELKLIKIFQTQIFKFFLEGTTLHETYSAVAEVANRWLDVLHLHGSTLADEELIDLICENRSMTKTLEEYGSQKSTSITTARRLAEFLGDQMVKDKGLNCKYIISAAPKGSSITERAVPVAIFSAEPNVKRFFLRKWLKEDPGDMDPRSIIDWEYYLERLGSVIQKLITIPAALQKVRNPVPRVPHPDWLQRRIDIKDDKFKQKKMTDLFDKTPLSSVSTNIMDHRLPTAGDIEDAMSTQKLKTQISTQMSQKRKAPESSQSTDPFASLPAKMPSMNEDYEGWLKYQKQKWKIQKHARLRRRKLFGERTNVATDALSNFFRNQAELTYVSTWQILQFRETDIPGEIRAFVLIDRKVHAITVKVPRQLFINFRDDQLPDVDIEGCTVQKVNHALPNGHPSVHLFQLTMPEFTYVKDVATISALLDHPSVEGVYESKVPLDIRTVLKLGTLCTFDESQRGVLGKGLEHGFELSTLLKAAPTQTYLADSQFEFVFVYHIVSGDRQIFSVFSTRRDEAHIVIFSKQRDGQGFPNVDKIYANSLRRRIEEGNNENWQQVFEYQHALHFRTMQVTAKRKAHLEVGDLLRKFRNESSYPTLIVLQSLHKQQLLHEVSAFKDFPVLSLRSDPSDNELPRLGWQPFVAKQIVMHYLALDSWISHLIEFARYGDIPLCNLERDDPKFLIDIAYARRLEQNNVVLWWSPNPLPDHAGYEKDNINSLIQKVDMPTINNPGAYSSVCIDLDVRNLAINTILTSSLINDLEGSESVLLNPSAPTGQEVSDGTGVLYSDTAFSSAGIVVLRDMVKAWWAEACQGKVMADVMVQHLIRWVESPDCNLYDRALHQYVQMMSKKALQQLMGDFRRVGSSVIFASPNRLLLQTTKTEVGNAYAYSQYILKSIKSKPLFNFLDLEIKEYWEYLLWYDEFNYGGKACHEVVESNSQELETIMHWQMGGFLPSPLQPVFNDWVVEYIEIMHGLKKSNKSLDSDESRPTQIQFKSMTETEGIDVTNVLSESYSKALKRQIVGLIRRQRDEMLHPELVSDYDFPTLPGAFWHDTKRERNPTLELVKYLTHVLSLSKHTSLEVRILRRELLALFDIKEFSDAGKFENPSASLKLPQLICNHCTMSRDLDLCRDGDLLPEEGGSAASKAWCCLYCGTEYDRLALEERMIGEVQGIVVEWQTQDLKCEKCGGLMVNPLMEHCSCGGRWTTMLDRRAAERKVRIFKSVAEFYGLKMLTIVTNGVLDGL